MSFFRRYTRFVIFLAVALAVGAGLCLFLDPRRALLLGFDAGVAAFIASMIGTLGKASEAAMRQRAKDNEPDHHILTIFALGIVGVVLAAVWLELTGQGGSKGAGVAIAAATLLMAWLFANLLFALHYAHVWYSKGKGGKDCGGLEFPGEDPTPDYWDFAYYAFVLGMTFQVSDVQITEGRMRRLALLHGLLAFVFNIVVVAMSVSLVADLLKG